MAELNRRARSDAEAFDREPKSALASLKDLIAECRVETPAPLPPMASGLFGYMGYNMVGLMERLPDQNPDTLGIPDGMFLRPTIVCIFDNLQARVTLVPPVWPNAEPRAPPTISRASGLRKCSPISSATCPIDARRPRRLRSCRCPRAT
jgi:anthranilate synthase component 1